MQTEDGLTEKLKALIEDNLGWGKSESWTNQDFHELSERVLAKTGVNVSAVTLKRIWGRVKYGSAPSITTLDTLACFIGYENWRDFKSKELIHSPGQKSAGPVQPLTHTEFTPQAPNKRSRKTPAFLSLGALIVFVCASIYISYSFLVKHIKADPRDYSFSSRTVITDGIPNSVIFDIDATRSPDDSILLQQSWDERLQAKIPKDQRQHTAIYYYPGNFSAKLIVGGKVVKEHNLLIRSNGWLPIVEHFPVPTYLKKEEVINGGKMEISLDQVRAKGNAMEPSPPVVAFYNTRSFGEIYTDDFTFETAVKNNYSENSGVCQKTYVMLQCINNMVWIPLCTRGCVSEANLGFTNYQLSGKKADLSAFGVNFSDYVKLRIEAKKGKARIFLNDRLAHSITENIVSTKIVGIGFRFHGAGSVDYVKLSNGKVKYEDDFER